MTIGDLESILNLKEFDTLMKTLSEQIKKPDKYEKINVAIIAGIVRANLDRCREVESVIVCATRTV